MNQKEIQEIKKQFRRKTKCISRICGCYFDIDGQKKLSYATSFLNLPEDEDAKYLKLLEGVLSGRIGRNLHNCAYDRNEELHGVSHELLMRLRETELKDPALLEQFYDLMVAKLPKDMSYLLLLAHCYYDVPVKGEDGFLQQDESDQVYSYLIAAICPVELAEGALSYNEEDNRIENRFRDWIVEAPLRGFLFPAFTDRSTDIHTLLYYVKKSEYLTDPFLQEAFGLEALKPDKEQRENFTALVSGIGAEEPVDLETVSNIHEELDKSIEAHKDDSVPFALDKPELKGILRRSGVAESQMDRFDSLYTDCCGDYPLLAANVAGGKRLQIEVKDIRISVPKESLGFLETRVLDGKKCLIITADDDMSVDGVPVEIK